MQLALQPVGLQYVQGIGVDVRIPQNFRPDGDTILAELATFTFQYVLPSATLAASDSALKLYTCAGCACACGAGCTITGRGGAGYWWVQVLVRVRSATGWGRVMWLAVR